MELWQYSLSSLGLMHTLFTRTSQKLNVWSIVFIICDKLQSVKTQAKDGIISQWIVRFVISLTTAILVRFLIYFSFCYLGAHFTENWISSVKWGVTFSKGLSFVGRLICCSFYFFYFNNVLLLEKPNTRNFSLPPQATLLGLITAFSVIFKGIS